MKELFSKDTDSLIFPTEDQEVFEVYDVVSKSTVYLGSDGQTIEPPFEQVDETASSGYTTPEDPTFFEDAGDGFYVYTTHAYRYDPDGAYGCFGIKNASGVKITEEIFYQVDYFVRGLCPVCMQDEKWGCIDGTGQVVIPMEFDDPPRFNRYGVADVGCFLIDIDGKTIDGTEHNSSGYNSKYCRYFELYQLSEQELNVIYDCGSAPGLRTSIYDTKMRCYIVEDIPEDVLNVAFCDVEPDVIIAAAGMIPQYDKIDVSKKGIIICQKGRMQTVFDYYKN